MATKKAGNVTDYTEVEQAFTTLVKYIDECSGRVGDCSNCSCEAECVKYWDKLRTNKITPAILNNAIIKTTDSPGRSPGKSLDLIRALFLCVN